MSKIGDRIALESRGGPRTGVITAVREPMITVRWDNGGETSLVPGAGALRLVETAAPRSSPTRKAPPARKAGTKNDHHVEREETRYDNQGTGQEVRQAKRDEGILTIKEGGDQESCEVERKEATREESLFNSQEVDGEEARHCEGSTEEEGISEAVGYAATEVEAPAGEREAPLWSSLFLTAGVIGRRVVRAGPRRVTQMVVCFSLGEVDRERFFNAFALHRPLRAAGHYVDVGISWPALLCREALTPSQRRATDWRNRR